MSAATHTRIRITLLVSAALYHGTGAAQPDADEFTPYRAVYELFDGDKRVGRSVFSLRYDPAADRYEFETRSEFRGLLRLLAPRPIVERSLFTVVDDSIRPLEFSYRDGTWRGRRNADLRFDWIPAPCSPTPTMLRTSSRCAPARWIRAASA
jgi:hypothetical protein